MVVFHILGYVRRTTGPYTVVTVPPDSNSPLKRVKNVIPYSSRVEHRCGLPTLPTLPLLPTGPLPRSKPLLQYVLISCVCCRFRRSVCSLAPPPLWSSASRSFSFIRGLLRKTATLRLKLRFHLDAYCMPEEGVPQSPPPHLLAASEISLLSSLFVSQGVTKIRLTGGEPTVWRDILPLMRQRGSLRSQDLRELCLTTSGLIAAPKIKCHGRGRPGWRESQFGHPGSMAISDHEKAEGIRSSDEEQSIAKILEMNKLGASFKLKINCVVMRGMNETEILPFVESGRGKKLEVRFIQYMPFDNNKWSQGKMLGYREMLEMVNEKDPAVMKVQNH